MVSSVPSAGAPQTAHTTHSLELHAAQGPLSCSLCTLPGHQEMVLGKVRWRREGTAADYALVDEVGLIVTGGGGSNCHGWR